MWLSAMELDVHDADLLFELIDHPDDGESTLSAEELVAGVGRLKGSARRLDMEVLHRDVKELKTHFCDSHAPEMLLQLANLRRDVQSLCGLAGGSAAHGLSHRRLAPAAEEPSASRSRSPGHDPRDVAKRIGHGRRGEKSQAPPALSHHFALTNLQLDGIAAAVTNSGSGQPLIIHETSGISSMDETV